MKVQVFGTGCPSCKTMLDNVHAAVAGLAVDCDVEQVTRVQAMLEAGITGTPALVVDGRVESVGRALDVPAIEAILRSAAGREGS